MEPARGIGIWDAQEYLLGELWEGNSFIWTGSASSLPWVEKTQKRLCVSFIDLQVPLIVYASGPWDDRLALTADAANDGRKKTTSGSTAVTTSARDAIFTMLCSSKPWIQSLAMGDQRGRLF